MFIAVLSGRKVLEVVSNESSSLEGMKAYARLGYNSLRRIVVDKNVFVAYSNGADLETDIEVDNGKATTVFVPTNRPHIAADPNPTGF